MRATRACLEHGICKCGPPCRKAAVRFARREELPIPEVADGMRTGVKFCKVTDWAALLARARGISGSFGRKRVAASGAQGAMRMDVDFRNSAERRALRVAQDAGIATPLSVADDAVEVVQLRLDAENARTADLAACLSDAERARAGRFVFERDRRRFIVGRARLRELLASRLRTRPDRVELDNGPRGKPRLAGSFAESDLRFNLSHCGDVALFAFSRGREIGVDVEAVREMRDADAIAARFFSPRENQSYLALAPRDRALGFFNCWTRKEAFIKALGEGLHYPLAGFDVSLAPGEPARILRIGDAPDHDGAWRLESLAPASGMVAAVVVQGHLT